MRASALVLIGLLSGNFGCRASVNANANLNAKSDGQQESFADNDGEKGQGESDWNDAQLALLGARHDLKLAEGKGAGACKCLSAVVGGPQDPSFIWTTTPPRTDPSSQLVVALASESCEGAPADSLGASYWGYRRSGDDVIIVVENAKIGRPITQGAIIPRPFGDGQVFVAPGSKSVPYGRPVTAGEKLCRLTPAASTTN